MRRAVGRALGVAVLALLVTTAASSSPTTPSRGTVVANDATWRLPAPVAREVVVPSGRRFTVVGGLDATRFSTASIVEVDPATGASRRAGTLAEAVHDAAGVRIGSRIEVFGGGGPSENGTADVQTVAASGATAVSATLPQPRSDLAAARVHGATYLVGGFDGATILADVLRTTDGSRFTAVGALPVPVRYPAVAVVGRVVYVFGGVMDSARGLDTDAVQRIDTVTGSVTQVARLPAPLSHAAAAVFGGRVYLLGGFADSTRLSDQILRFDPATRTTEVVGHLPAPISDAAAVVVGGRVDVVGGEGTDRSPRSTVTIVRVR